MFHITTSLFSIRQTIKLLNSKGWIAFLFSLAALILIPSEVKAQQVLMKSDRRLEYPYR